MLECPMGHNEHGMRHTAGSRSEVRGEDVPARGGESDVSSRCRDTMYTRGVVFVHGAPASLCPHITWALEAVLGPRVTLDWTPQPAGPRLVRAELSWSAEAGTGAELASAMRGWDSLRYEVTEEPSPGVTGRAGPTRHASASTTPGSRPRATPSCTRTDPRPRWPALPATRRRSRTRSTCCSAALGRGARALPPRRRRRAGAVAAPGRLSQPDGVTVSTLRWMPC